MKGEVGVLSEEEVISRRLCMIKIQKLSARNCSYLWQRSRIKWLNEGDTNSKFFHRCIQKNRKINEILGLNLMGYWLRVLNL